MPSCCRSVLIASLLVLGLTLSCAAVSASRSLGVFESEDARFEAVVVADGLETPWGLAFLPGGRLLVTERSGRMNIVDPVTGMVKRIRGLPKIATGNQGGLLDVIIHPNFTENHWIYFSYSAKNGRGRSTHVARAQLINDQLAQLEVLFIAKPFLGATKHFGSRLVIDQNGYLYITIGDRGSRHLAQDLSAHMGKVIRLHDDGRVPTGNPFLNNPDAQPEIYTYGHRNPQGLTRHLVTGALWSHEHGPRGGDEVNIIEAGKNYGWPVITYGKEYSGGSIGEGTHKAGMEQPIKYYVPSIAPSGMTFYSGQAFPGWRGNLFIGAMVLTHLNRLVLDDEMVVGEERLMNGYSVRDVREDPTGLLYLLVDEGLIIRLQPVD